MDRLEPSTSTSPLVIAAAWVLVTIPLAWGVYQSVVKSLPLLRISHVSATPPAAVAKSHVATRAPGR